MTGVDRDILISRVIDGEATPEDWNAFKALASRDQSIWGELAETQQDHAELCAAVGDAVAVADSVEVPFEAHLAERLGDRLRLVGRWAGWAAAAAVGVMWATSAGLVPGAHGGGRAGIGPEINSPDGALDHYLDVGSASGRVVDRRPDRQVVEVVPNPNGEGYVIRYNLVIPEKVVVEQVYTEGRNEFGRPTPVPVRPAPKNTWHPQ